MQAMTLHDLLLDGLATAAGLGAALLLLKRLPLVPRLAQLNTNIHKAFHVIGASGISDHWKELVVPRYALSIMIGSSCLAVYLLAVLGMFVAGFVAAQLPFVDAPQDALARLFRPEPQVMALVMGIGLVLTLRRNRQ